MRLHYGTTILNPGLIWIVEVLAREHFLLYTILMIHHYDNLQNKSKLASNGSPMVKYQIQGCVFEFA